MALNLLQSAKQAYEKWKARPANTFTKGIVTKTIPTIYNRVKSDVTNWGTAIGQGWNANAKVNQLAEREKREREITAKNNLRIYNLMQQGKKAEAQRLARSANKDTGLRSDIAKTQQDFKQGQKDVVKYGIRTAGYLPNITPIGLGGYGLSALIGAGGAKLQGQDPYIGAGEGIASAKRARLLTQFSDPLISSTMGQYGDKLFKSSLGRQLTTRMISGIGNVAEDELLAKFDQTNPGTIDRMVSFGIGFVMSNGGKDSDFSTLKDNIIRELKQSNNSFKLDAQGKYVVSKIMDGVEKANEAYKNSPLAGEGGYFNPTASVSPAKSKLKALLTYHDDLFNKGFSQKELKNISIEDYKLMMDHDMSAQQWRTATKNAQGTGLTARERIKLLDDLKKGIDPTKVKSKANFVDYIRTPKNVFKKIGLGKEVAFLDKKWLDYKQQLPVELKKIDAWKARAPSPGSEKRIFQYLDGQNVKLESDEQQVATEIKDYLAGWADELGLDKDKRVSDYITHIFPKGAKEQEFDPELARLIENKTPSSVYDPFLQERKGAPDYIQDVWLSLDAYVKRATRKTNVDPALEKIQQISDLLPSETQKYIQRYLSNVNMRPSEIDTLIDNAIKSSPIGYKLGQRPMANVAPKVRQTIYRGAIGLNPGSAVKNLSQISNTYAELGEKHTLMGFIDALRKGNDPELTKSGIFEDSYIQDRNLGQTKKIMQKVDEVLFYMFDKTERFNRMTAYWGAKRKGLSEGLSEDKARLYARRLVEKTQFKFGAIDTPVALSMGGDTLSLFTQFKTFALKQGEFLTEKAIKKEWGGLIRYIASMTLLTKTMGKFFGWDLKDMLIPDPTGQSPFVSTATNVPKAFSEDEMTKTKARKDLKRSASLLIPGGGQIRKSIEGYSAYKKGYSETPSGRVRFPVKKGTASAIQNVAFGQWAPENAKDYVEGGFKSLGDSQSKVYKQYQDMGLGQDYFDYVSQQRELDSDEDAIYDYLKTNPGKYDLQDNIDPTLTASAVFRYIKTLDKDKRDEAFKQLEVSDEIKSEVKKIAELDSKGLTIEDRKLLQMPVSIRVVAVYNRIMKLTAKNRQKKYRELLNTGVITPEMVPLLKKLTE